MGAILLGKNACGNVPTSLTKLGASKILVPRKNGEPERRSLSVCRGARGDAGPPPGVWGAGSPPGTAGGLRGGSPPSKNNLMVKR